MRRFSGWVTAGLAAAMLIACSRSAPQMRVEVSGDAADVAVFVEAEKARDADIQVTHAAGATSAVFLDEDADTGHAIASRAIAARLNTQVRSSP